jgi:ribosome production factor 1
MGRKRKASESEAEDAFEKEKENEEYRNKQQQKKKAGEIVPSMIRNKERRSEVHAKLKHQKKVEKRKKIQARDAAEKRALELGEEVPCLIFFFLFL